MYLFIYLFIYQNICFYLHPCCLFWRISMLYLMGIALLILIYCNAMSIWNIQKSWIVKEGVQKGVAQTSPEYFIGSSSFHIQKKSVNLWSLRITERFCQIYKSSMRNVVIMLEFFFSQSWSETFHCSKKALGSQPQRSGKSFILTLVIDQY